MDMFLLRDKLAEVAPVVCVSIGKNDDKSTWEARYTRTPTDKELAAVKAVIDAYVLLTPQQVETKAKSMQLLSTTDWKVLRHQDQVTLGVATSLLHEEYIELLQQRQAAREAVAKEG